MQFHQKNWISLRWRVHLFCSCSLNTKHTFWFQFHLFLSFDILQCSASCGRGFKSRKVVCASGSGRPVPEENCQHLSPKPRRQKRCKGGRCPKWKTGNWGEVRTLWLCNNKKHLHHSGSHATTHVSSLFPLQHLPACCRHLQQAWLFLCSMPGR